LSLRRRQKARSKCSRKGWPGKWEIAASRSTTFQPGSIDTDLNLAAGEWAVPQKALTALNRYGSVDDVAALLAFVAGPEASYISGASLTVDGGTNA
jgi:NAD(P)-dependent dehydrogenase (short-subunit alcohol dehydrogenase family)